MRNKLIITIGAVVFIIISVCFYAKIHENKIIVENNKILTKKNYIKDRSIACLKQNYIYSHRYISDSLVNLHDIENNEISIKDIFQKNDSIILICTISEQYCTSCIDYAIKIATECNYTNTIFLANDIKRRTLLNISKKYSIIDKQIYGIEEYMSDADNLLLPYFLFVSKGNKVKAIYIPFEANDEQDKEMLRLMLNNLNKELKRNTFPCV